MSDGVIVALIGLVSGTLTAMIGALSEWLRDRQRLALERARLSQEGVDTSSLGPATADPWKWAFVGLVVALLFTAALLVAVQVIVSREPTVLPTNAVLSFDCETLAGWETVDVFDEGWQFTGSLEAAARVAGQETEGRAYCAYALPLTAGDWRDYALTYAQQVQAEVIRARFLLDDSDHRVQDSVIGLVVLEGAQRLAQSVIAAPNGKWTEVTLDLRQFRDPSGTPLDQRYITLQVTVSLFGESGINADAHVTIGLDDLILLRGTGQTAQPDPVAYASSGLSAFIPSQTVAADLGDFAWTGSSQARYVQATQPEIIYTTIGDVTGPLLRYPVTLRSALSDSRTYQVTTQEARLSRLLREPERASLHAVIAALYIASDVDARVHVTPFVNLNNGVDARGFGYTIQTNRWQNVVWSQLVDATDFGTVAYPQLEALRATVLQPSAGSVRLADMVPADQIERFGLQFLVESGLEPGQEYTLDATVYLGNVTFLP